MSKDGRIEGPSYCGTSHVEIPESGGADVYVHASALRRSGISTLAPEQKVRFSTRQGTKGVEVDRIELA